MIKHLFLAGLKAIIYGTLISVIYLFAFKFSPLKIDFTEKASIPFLFFFNLKMILFYIIIYFVLLKTIINKKKVTIINGILVNVIAIIIALYWMFYLESELIFNNKSAEVYKEYYHFILAPTAFFPVLSWFAFKPIF
jgi:hypothetical protein